MCVGVCAYLWLEHSVANTDEGIVMSCGVYQRRIESTLISQKVYLINII